MARSIWSGSISFGLLNVPVKLYSAVARRGIALNEIRESDSSRVKHRKVAEGTDEEVSKDEIVKGYKIAEGRYVVLSNEEMEALRPEKSKSIDVQDFVEIAEIDPKYFNSPYYLGPAAGAEKAYSLLAAALESSGKAAIARFVFRNKEQLGAIRADDGVLTLTTMRFADEVVPASELEDAFPESKGKVAKKEQQMAEALIESLTSKFDPTAYRDEYREELLALIETKAEGKEIVAPEAEAPKATKTPDLMAALEESIAAVKGKRTGKETAKPAAKPASKKASAKSKSASKAKAKPKAKAKKSKSAKAKSKSAK